MRAVLAIPGVEHVVVSNGFGLPVARVSAPSTAAGHEAAAGSGEAGGDEALDAQPVEEFLSIVFAKAAEGADRLGLGRTRAAVLVASSFVLVQASLAPLVVAALARPTVDVDVLAAAVPALADMLEPLCEAAVAVGV